MAGFRVFCLFLPGIPGILFRSFLFAALLAGISGNAFAVYAKIRIRNNTPQKMYIAKKASEGSLQCIETEESLPPGQMHAIEIQHPSPNKVASCRGIECTITKNMYLCDYTRTAVVRFMVHFNYKENIMGRYYTQPGFITSDYSVFPGARKYSLNISDPEIKKGQSSRRFTYTVYVPAGSKKQ